MPTVENCNAQDVTKSSATLSAQVTDDGGDEITERGFYYGTSPDPTTNKTVVSGTTGEMTADITDLSANTKYYVKAYATNGQGTAYDDCVFTSLALSVVETVKAANFISPDGDGYNDYWVIENIDEMSEYNLIIFNNIGEKVYEVNRYANEWDATYDGIQLNAGTYYYLFTKENDSKKGFITVVR